LSKNKVSKKNYQATSLRGNATNGSHDRGNLLMRCTNIGLQTPELFSRGLLRSVPPLAMTAFGSWIVTSSRGNAIKISHGRGNPIFKGILSAMTADRLIAQKARRL